MARYFAQIEAGQVTRVIVARSLEWCESRLGGTWEETADPYAAEPQTLVYPGPGYGYDPAFPEKFGAPWVEPAPDPETGIWSSYAKGDVRSLDGQLWKSTVDGNVWEPGISGWHPQPDIEGVRPRWIQPTGSHDTWAEGVEVFREIEGETRYFRSNIPNNATIPGTPESGPPFNYWIETDVDGNEITPPEPSGWVDSGATAAGPSGANTMGVSDDSPFAADQRIRVDQNDSLVTTVTGIHSNNLLLISPHITVGSGQMIEIEQ